jgi:putative peptidoglycan lipid II flippase
VGAAPEVTRRARLPAGTLAAVAGAASAIAVITVLARVAGFGRWLVFSGAVGASCIGSAYSTANLVPNVLFEVVAGGALAASVVPVLSAALVAGDREGADRIASALLTWTVLVLTPLAVLVAGLAGPATKLLLGAPACPGQAASAARMLAVFAPQVVLYGVSVVLTGVLQAHRRFLGPALAPLVSSPVAIGAYLLFGALAHPPSATSAGPAEVAGWLPGRSGEALLAWGTTAGVLALSVPLLIPVLRAGVRLRPTLRLGPGVAARASGLAVAGLAGLLAQQVLVLVTARLANGAGAGALNVYQYAQAVYLLPYAVLAVPLATAAFPELASLAARRDGPGFARLVVASTRLVVLVSAAGAGVLVAVAPAVGGLFLALDRGGLGVDALAGTLSAYAPGLVGLALVAHLGRALFAVGAAGVAGRATVAGWLTASAGSVLLVALLARRGPDAGAVTLVALGLASTAGMSVAGGWLLVGMARIRVDRHRVGAALAGSLPALVRYLLLAAVAAPAGRLVTDRLLEVGTWPALRAGVVGSVATLGVLVVGLALTDRAGLRALLRRDIAAG